MRGAAAFVDIRRRTTHKCSNLYFTDDMLTTHDGTAVIDAKARYWSKIATFAAVHHQTLITKGPSGHLQCYVV